MYKNRHKNQHFLVVPERIMVRDVIKTNNVIKVNIFYLLPKQTLMKIDFGKNILRIHLGQV